MFKPYYQKINTLFRKQSKAYKMSFNKTIFFVLILSLSFIYEHGFLRDGSSIYRTGDYRERVISTMVTENKRNLGNIQEYEYNNTKWIQQKIPFTHS